MAGNVVEGNIPLRELKLRPGMNVQVTRKGQGTALACTFCAALQGKGLMITLAGGGELDRLLPPGNEVELTGFTGQHDFRFSTRVLQTFIFPFEYALFAWPEQVSAKAVRAILRVSARLPVMVMRQGGWAPIAASLADLSAAGALVQSKAPLGAVNERVDLMFTIEFEGKKIPLELGATICHSAASEDGHRVGVSFENVSRNDKLLLSCYTLSQSESHGVI